MEISTGSLGQGLSCALGMALGGRADHKGFYTYALLGDGECQAGQVWEAAMYAGSKKIKRIVAIIDYNKVQLASMTCEAVDLEPLGEKWLAFGWQLLSCDGHRMQEVVNTLEQSREASNKGPVVIIAHTVKGFLLWSTTTFGTVELPMTRNSPKL